MHLQRPCVAKLLDPPALAYDERTARVCDPEVSSTADGIRAPEEGSIIVVVAADAPLTPDQLKRLARRVSVGLGREGSIEGDESGDIFLAFSTANAGADEGNSNISFQQQNAITQRMQSWKMDALFTAVVAGNGGVRDQHVDRRQDDGGRRLLDGPALPHDQLQEVLRKHGLLQTSPVVTVSPRQP